MVEHVVKRKLLEVTSARLHGHRPSAVDLHSSGRVSFRGCLVVHVRMANVSSVRKVRSVLQCAATQRTCGLTRQKTLMFPFRVIARLNQWRQSLLASL